MSKPIASIAGRITMFLVTLLCLFAAPQVCNGQDTSEVFSGVVVDDDGSPVVHAEAGAPDGAVVDSSTADGKFSFNKSSQGPVTVRVSALAYDTATVTIQPNVPAR